MQKAQLEKEFPLHHRDNKEFIKINFFDYIEWREQEIIDTLDQIGWKAENHGSWRFDCRIHALSNFLNRKLYGFAEQDEFYSRMSRKGLITRAEAMHKINTAQEKEHTELEIINDLFVRTGIKKQTITALMNSLSS